LEPLAGWVETGDAVRSGSLASFERLEAEARGGGGCTLDEAMDGWPMEVTTASSMPWKLAEAAECTEPMRWRLATKRFGGDLSRVRVERSSRVRVRGRVVLVPESRAALR
jgi:hypothetical protein